ncbi:MAG: NAD(P)-binding protein [Pseudomonadales bacterium]|nr:NAD(P)-binding protein [Pseudomonadales bacterium]
MAKRIGVIGAGIAGAWIGNQLRDAGHDVVVFEKSRGMGGRMATRRNGDFAFDHGAQFFTARTKEFRTLIESCPEVVAQWQPRLVTLGDVEKTFKREWFEPHFVCVPGMGSLCRELLMDVPVELQTEITDLQQSSNGWCVYDHNGRKFDCHWIISTAPAEQTRKLLPFAPLETVTYAPCFTLMAGLETRPTFDAAVVRGRALEWLAVTASRPGRPARPGIIAHASGDWSREHYDVDQAKISQWLIEELRELGVAVGSHVSLHRWRYARVMKPHREPYWLDGSNRVAACGDWGIGARIEDAFGSANLLLPRLIDLWEGKP